MPRFTLQKTVRAPRRRVYDIMSGYADYAALLPQHFPSVRVRSVRGDVAVAEEHIRLGGTELIVMAKHVSSPPALHEVFVIGGDARGSHIRHEFAEIREGTLVTARVEIRLRGVMRARYAFGAGGRFEADYSRMLDDFAGVAGAGGGSGGGGGNGDGGSSNSGGDSSNGDINGN